MVSRPDVGFVRPTEPAVGGGSLVVDGACLAKHQME
jgi:hypothetical protein